MKIFTARKHAAAAATAADKALAAATRTADRYAAAAYTLNTIRLTTIVI